MRFGNVSENIKFVVVGILMLIALMLPHMHISSHNPLTAVETNIERHLELGSEVPEHAAHSHDNGTHQEANLEHQHGHNNADHTHLSVFLSAHDMPTGFQLNFWSPAYSRNHLSPSPPQWQRPPKKTRTS
tara:strand:+ start:976 stop:1365 length:390 start_codon:yes stop_codon:yes gene_type:complete